MLLTSVLVVEQMAVFFQSDALIWQAHPGLGSFELGLNVCLFSICLLYIVSWE